MSSADLLQAFREAAIRVGAQVKFFSQAQEAAAYISDQAGGLILVPPSPALERLDLAGALRKRGCDLASRDFRVVAPQAPAGVSGANFAIADTGTIVLESTDEATRLATTLPERHFVLLDPRKIVADGLAAIPWVRRLQQRRPRSFLAYISGPSRTADIERVLTIGVHGPCELHILLLDGLSDDFLEN
ncbi:LutC/YkgG family protein [Geoalkalibacter sp.]|uniref:LutC/YkgG family protein n=1 Tax=Geoalkalibacter sp. TaxID=3041440 RepID=UPI00272E9313|nr:lactate utilization protein [Geoalkalibacter sp.]